MILDPNLYKDSLDKSRETILRGLIEEERVKYDLLTIFSLGSHIPFAAVVSYALRPDVGGSNPALEAILAETIDFYKYAAVLPWSDLG